MRIRTVRTASGKYSLQIVSKYHGKLTVHKHIGTYENGREKHILLEKARQYIQHVSAQTDILDYLSAVRLQDIIITESKPLFAYQLFSRVYDAIGFSSYHDDIIKDLVIARLYYPASKLETQEILHDCFGKSYALKTIYRHLKKSMESGIKDRYQNALIQFTKNTLHDNLKLVFYDVTTLFFESQVKSELKDFGFSKDHRPGDTQIVIGLVVTKAGFPLYFDIFTGNTFEGHTFTGVVETIRQLLGTQTLVVVADSAMISVDNMDTLDEKGVGFIVGARVANLPLPLVKTISKRLKKQDGAMITASYQGYRLICQYSQTRAAQDKSQREKQLERAQDVIQNPSRATRAYRFLKKKGQAYAINSDLITKAELLEGIKGYITNTQLKNQTIIDRYHDLWQIEKSFRITKSDLAARPIFHRLEDTIKAHMIIVFASLAIAKYIELQTKMSIHRVLKLCSKVLTHKITHTTTGETVYMETTIEDPILKQKIEMLKVLGH